MQIGDKARDKPTFGDAQPRDYGRYESEVVYIHPERRFYRAKFTFYPARYSLCECFPLGNRRGNA